jgi:ADP-ribose pyrophosphatase YjhB (NUDIX family)
MVKQAPEKIRFAALATDVVLFTISEEKLKVLLMRVVNVPLFKNKWGFPGGLVKPKETATEAAKNSACQRENQS